MISRISYPWTEYSYQYPDGHFDTWTFEHVSRIPKIRKYAEENGLSPLRSVWLYDSTKTERYINAKGKTRYRPTGNKIGDFHTDLDSPNLDTAQKQMIGLLDSLEQLYDLDPFMLYIGFTGSKGFNLRIPLECYLQNAIPEPKAVYKKFGEFLRLSYPCIDMGIYIKRRLWKIENSRHPKTGLYRIEIRTDELKELSIDQIKDLAQAPRWLNHRRPVYSEKLGNVFSNIINYQERFKVETIQTNQTNGRTDFSDLSPEDRIPKKYRSMVSEGNRNPTICRLVGTLESAGCGYHEAAEIVKAFNRRYCSPSKSDDEALIPVRHFYGVKG